MFESTGGAMNSLSSPSRIVASIGTSNEIGKDPNSTTLSRVGRTCDVDNRFLVQSASEILLESSGRALSKDLRGQVSNRGHFFVKLVKRFHRGVVRAIFSLLRSRLGRFIIADSASEDLACP